MPGARQLVHTEGLFHLPCIAQDRANTGIGGSAGAHVDEVAGDIGGVDAVFFDKTEGVLEIGSGADGGFEGAVLLVATAAAVEGGMSGHPPGLEEPGGEGAALPAAYDFALLVDELQVAMDSITRGVGGEMRSYVGQHVVIVVVIVRIQEADNLAGSHGDALVHGVIDAIVLLGNPAHAALVFFRILADDFHSIISAATVHNDVLHIGMRLAQHAFEGVADGGGAVEAGCDDGDFHGSVCFGEFQAVFQRGKPVVALRIGGNLLVVGEITEGFVDESGALAEQHEPPAAARKHEHAPAMQGSNPADKLGGVAVLCILRPEGAAFLIVDHELHKLHEVADVEHGALVAHRGEHGQLARQGGELGEVALAAFAVDHGRAENDDTEGRIRELAQADFRLHFAVAIEIGGRDGGVAGDMFALADGGAVAIHDGAAHEDELRHALSLGLGGGFDGKLGVDFVVEGLALLAHVPGIGMGDTCDMVHGIVSGEAGVAPAAIHHIDSGDAVELGPLRKVFLKRGAYVAVRAGDKDFLHSSGVGDEGKRLQDGGIRQCGATLHDATGTDEAERTDAHIVLQRGMRLDDCMISYACKAADGGVGLNDAPLPQLRRGGHDGGGVDEAGELRAALQKLLDAFATHLGIADGADEHIPGLNLVIIRCAEDGSHTGRGGRVGVHKAAHAVCPGVYRQVIHFATKTAGSYDDEILHVA